MCTVCVFYACMCTCLCGIPVVTIKCMCVFPGIGLSLQIPHQQRKDGRHTDRTIANCKVGVVRTGGSR